MRLIKFKWLKPREFGLIWQKKTRMFYIGLYYFVIRLDFGKKWRAKQISDIRVKEIEKVKTHFGKYCPVCKDPLRPNSVDQIVYFHGECRTEGRKMVRKGTITV